MYRHKTYVRSFEWKTNLRCKWPRIFILSNSTIIFVYRLKCMFFFKSTNMNNKGYQSRKSIQDLIKHIRLFTGSKVIYIKTKSDKEILGIKYLRTFVAASWWFYFDFGRTNKVIPREREREKKKVCVYIYIYIYVWF
jgi:hypothetical protein